MNQPHKTIFLNAINAVPDKILPKQAGLREMRNVELFFICYFILELNPKLIFESGVWKGRSTAILSVVASLIGATVVSCCSKPTKESNRVAAYFDNLTMIHGKGEKILPRYDPCIVVSDGPKANTKQGVKLLNIAAQKKSVKMVFQHDVAKEPDGTNFRRVAKTHGKEWGMIPKEFLEANRDLDGKVYRGLLGYWK